MEHFGKSHFGTDVSSQEHFSTCTFWHCRRSGRQTFQHGNISTWGLFGMRNFWHYLLLTMCRNVQVPKHPCAEMFRCPKFLVPKIPCAENSPCQNVTVLKSPSAGTSAAPNDACAKMFPWWNIRVEMTLAEMFRAEMVYRPVGHPVYRVISVILLKCCENTVHKNAPSKMISYQCNVWRKLTTIVWYVYCLWMPKVYLILLNAFMYILALNIVKIWCLKKQNATCKNTKQIQIYYVSNDHYKVENNPWESKCCFLLTMGKLCKMK